MGRRRPAGCLREIRTLRRVKMAGIKVAAATATFAAAPSRTESRGSRTGIRAIAPTESAEAELPAIQAKDQAVRQGEKHTSLPARKGALMKMIAGSSGHYAPS